MKSLSQVLRWGGLAMAAILAGIQLIPVNRTNPPVQSEVDAPDDVAAILRRACYDCHSNKTEWPWYSYVAPMSWLVVDHVNHGRGDLNFSEWPILDFEAKEHAFKDIQEQISEGEMPLKSYTLIHRDARLSDHERDRLLLWARSQGLGE
jgi:hypothetical protein